MNKSIGVLIGLGLYLAGGSLAAADYVIVVIDPTRIVEQSPQYEAARAQLEKEVNDREQKLAEQQQQLTELQQQLERDAAQLSEEALQHLRTDIRNRGRKIKYARSELREDFSLRQNELRIKLARQVEEVVAELARKENIDLVVSDNLVFHASKRIDISDQVITRLKEKFEASEGL